MAFKLPNADQLQQLGHELGMNVDAVEAHEILDYLGNLAPAYELIDRLPDVPLPVKYPRTPGYRPDDDENPLKAWSVKTDIRGASSGKLAGRAIAIKDNVMIAGVPMLNGSQMFEGYVPDGDATIVTRLLDAGAHIVGKTVCEGFCVSGGSATSDSGPVENARVPGHTAGGSSTGSGAVVAAGDVELAIGCDQAGSIRIPSSFSGIVGIKPTYGLVPYTGILGLDYTIDHTGPMTRTVEDSALLLEVIAGDDGIDRRHIGKDTEDYRRLLGDGARGLRIGVVKEGFGRPESEAGVDEAVRAAAQRLKAAGAEVDEVSIPWHLYAPAIWAAVTNEGIYHNIMLGNGAGHGAPGAYPVSVINSLSGWRERADQLPLTMRVTLLLAKHTDENYHGRLYAKAQNLRRPLRAAYDALLQQYDVLLMPTTAMTATRIPEPGASIAEVLDHSWQMINNTCAFNLTGHPAISVPCGESDGKPVGLMMIGKHFDETTVFRAGQAAVDAV